MFLLMYDSFGNGSRHGGEPIGYGWMVEGGGCGCGDGARKENGLEQKFIFTM
jgi:hypothetical protein